MKKIFLLIIIALTFAFSPTSSVLAQEISLERIKVERVNPDSQLAYKAKRLKEKIIMFFKFSPKRKAGYYKVLLNRRLSELRYIVESENIAHIEKTSQRYEATAGQLAELIIEKNIKEEVNSAIDLFTTHQLITEKLRDNFSYDTAEWRFVMNDFNSLKIYSEKLSSF